MDRHRTIHLGSHDPGDTHGRPGSSPRALSILLALSFLLSFTSCAYYNTFYHAKRYYKQAEKTRQEFEAKPGAKDTRSANLYKQSIEKCQKVIDKYPGSKWQDDAHLLMAKAYYGRADYLNAKKTLKKFDDRFTDSNLYPEAKFWRGKTAYAQGEYPEARQVWEELLAEYPDFDDREDVEFYLAESEWRDGHNEKAEEAFEAYLAAYPGGEHAADTRIELGRVHLDNRDYDEAEQAFKEVAERGKEESDRNEARMFLGETLELQGRNEEALKLYNELAVDLDPAVYKWRMSEEELAILRQTELATAAEEAAAQAAEAAYQDSVRRAQAGAPDTLANSQGGMGNQAQNNANNPQTQIQNQTMTAEERAAAQRQAQQNLQRRRDMADPIDQQIAQILLREGGVTAKLGRPYEAIEVYEQVVVEFPRTPYASEAQFRIGYTYEVLLEDFDLAKDAYVEVNQHGVSSFREDAARRAKNLGTVAALLAQSATDSLSVAESAAAEAMFMRAELYLFQQESPEKALAEYEGIEREFPGTEHAAKAGLAVAWVTSHSLGDSAAAMQKYAETAAAFPNTEYGRRAAVMVYGPEKDPDPEEFAGPSVDELRAEENLAAIALMFEEEAAADSSATLAQEVPASGRPTVGNVAVGGTVARVGAGTASRAAPGDGSLSSAVRSTNDLVAVPDTSAAEVAGGDPAPVGDTTANTTEETENRPGESAAGVAAVGAAAVGAGIAAGSADTPPVPQEPMRMSDPSPTMAPVEADPPPIETGQAAVAPVGTPPSSPSMGGDLNPMIPVGGAAATAATETSPESSGGEMVPGALMEVPRDLYLDPLAVPEDGPSPVMNKDINTAANKPAAAPAKTPAKKEPAKKTEEKPTEKKESEKAEEPEKTKAPEKAKETEKTKEPEKKEQKKTEKAPEPKPDPGANP